MRIVYFDCLSGISGDMALGALLDLGVPIALLNEAVRSVLDGIRIESEEVVRKGFRATLARVIAPHEHVHRSLSTILDLIERGTLSDGVKEHASDIFRLLAEAEAKVHGVDVEKVHFHEVGAADSIADIVGAVVGFDFLGADEIRCSPVPTGCGTIEIAHGTCSVPAPATAELLHGVPLAASDVPFELTTPTGAALIKYFVAQFGPLPAMTIRSVGVGAGGRDLQEQPNILRLLVGDPEDDTGPLRAFAEHPSEHKLECPPKNGRQPDPARRGAATPKRRTTSLTGSSPETAWVIETNLDDLSGELIGHCVERLWSVDPLDVWTTPITMKKQRPGVTLSVLCRDEQIEAVQSILFAETTTLGIRRWPVERTVLPREACRLSTPWGDVDAKRAILPDGTTKTAPEFESLKKVAAEKGIPVRKIVEHVSEQKT